MVAWQAIIGIQSILSFLFHHFWLRRRLAVSLRIGDAITSPASGPLPVSSSHKNHRNIKLKTFQDELCARFCD
jgi:hypothetical protein